MEQTKTVFERPMVFEKRKKLLCLDAARNKAVKIMKYFYIIKNTTASLHKIIVFMGAEFFFYTSMGENES